MFLFLSESFVETCFLGPVTVADCVGWKRCPSRKFYIELMRVFAKLRECLIDKDSTEFASSDFERGLDLFSQPHLEYVLLCSFQRTRSGEAPTDKAIVWATTHWRQNKHPRKACCILFDPGAQVNARSAGFSTGPEIPVISPDNLESIEMSMDKFMQTVNKSNTCVSFMSVLGLRIIVNMISIRHQSRQKPALTPQACANFVMGLNLTTNVAAKIFWDDAQKVRDFFKNNLFRNNKRKTTLITESTLNVFKTQLLSVVSSANVWNAVFGKIDYLHFQRMFIAASNDEFDANLPEFHILESPGSVIGDAIDLKLSQNENLSSVVSFAAAHGTLTAKLMQDLASFRVTWQKNRVLYGNNLRGLVTPPVQAAVNANSVLAAGSKFSANHALMTRSNKAKLLLATPQH